MASIAWKTMDNGIMDNEYCRTPYWKIQLFNLLSIIHSLSSIPWILAQVGIFIELLQRDRENIFVYTIR